MNVASFRQHMPVARRWAYFDHAAVAPLPEPTRLAIEAVANEACHEGDVVWPQWARRVEQVRASAATLIGARPSEIAFVPNTTTGLSIVAEGFPWRAGDNVVTLANEFPSNLYPWMHLADRGVETRRVPVSEGVVNWHDVENACDSRTRMLALSWVGYSSGWRLDLEQVAGFARSRNIQVCLDAIQGLGVFPIDVGALGIDYLAADGHKWLLGPEGAGLLFIRQERLNDLRPTTVGWHSVVQGHDFSRIELRLRPDAARHEGGTANTLGILGLGASLDLLVSYGLSCRASPLAEQILEVVADAGRRIELQGGVIHSPRNGSHRSGILSFSLPDRDPQQVRQQCLAAGVVLSCRGNSLRLSPHAYCDTSDLVRLSEALAAVREGR